jgi:uncharacterized damage-inducible protein DinB
MNRPQTHEYPAWGETYIKLVDGDVIEILERQVTEFTDFINSLVEKADHAYAPRKWTIKEIIGHIIDAERVFVYRMTCFARGEQQHLPGFEEDDYVANAHFSDRSLLSLSHEFAQLRKANLYLFKSLTEEELNRKGTASGKEITVRAILFVTAGHIMHHTSIIKERYL